jgi:hypothetical protein
METVEQAIRTIMYFAERRAVFRKGLCCKFFVSLQSSSYGMDGIPVTGTIHVPPPW